MAILETDSAVEVDDPTDDLKDTGATGTLQIVASPATNEYAWSDHPFVHACEFDVVG